MTSNVNNKRSARRNNRKQSNRGRAPASQNALRIPRGVRSGFNMYKSPRLIMPVEFDTTFRYTVVYTVGSAAAVLASIRFQSNAYDVDPVLGSTAMAGFAELAALYARFRTLSMKYKFNACNSEAFPVTVIHGFSTAVVASGSLGMNYSENPLMHTGILGPLTGQCKGTFQQSASVVDISGTAQPLYDDLFTGSTTSSTLATSGTVHCYIGFGTPAANVFTAAGVLVHVEIDLHLRLYRPTFIIS
jgi:hypothetical protein